MNRVQYLLGSIAEECAEIAHRASKAIKYGWEEKEQGQDKTNLERLLDEYTDLHAVVKLLQAENLTTQFSPGSRLFDQFHLQKKQEQVEKWYKYSQERGLTYKPQVAKWKVQRSPENAAIMNEWADYQYALLNPKATGKLHRTLEQGWIYSDGDSTSSPNGWKAEGYEGWTEITVQEWTEIPSVNEWLVENANKYDFPHGWETTTAGLSKSEPTDTFMVDKETEDLYKSKWDAIPKHMQFKFMGINGILGNNVVWWELIKQHLSNPDFRFKLDQACRAAGEDSIHPNSARLETPKLETVLSDELIAKIEQVAQEAVDKAILNCTANIKPPTVSVTIQEWTDEHVPKSFTSSGVLKAMWDILPTKTKLEILNTYCHPGSERGWISIAKDGEKLAWDMINNKLNDPATAWLLKGTIQNAYNNKGF